MRISCSRHIDRQQTVEQQGGSKLGGKTHLPGPLAECSWLIQDSRVARLGGRGREGLQASRSRGPRQAMHTCGCYQMRLGWRGSWHKLRLRDRLRYRLSM